MARCQGGWGACKASLELPPPHPFFKTNDTEKCIETNQVCLRAHTFMHYHLEGH